MSRAYDLGPVEELVEELDGEEREAVASEQHEQDAADDGEVQRAAVEQAELDADEAAGGGGAEVVVEGVLGRHDHLGGDEVDGRLDNVLEGDVRVGHQEGVQRDAHDVEERHQRRDLRRELHRLFLREPKLRSLPSRRCRGSAPSAARTSARSRWRS